MTMMNKPEFDDIRPYNEDEIAAAMQRIAGSEVFPLLASYVFPDKTVEEARDIVRSYRTIREFQHDAMWRVNEQGINRSISQFTCSAL